VDKIRTIIVDDELRIQRGIERLVRSYGDEWEIVGTFLDGIEVILFLEENRMPIDLLITDVKMPEMDGLTLIKEIKARNIGHDFTSIIVSGYDDFEYLQTAIREGAFDYVLKPIDRTQFIEVLTNARLKIEQQRQQNRKWNDLRKDADKLAVTKQTQLLSETVATGPEDISTMYWIKDFPEGRYRLLYGSTDEFPYKTREYSPKDWGIMAYAMQNVIDEVVMSYSTSKGQMGWWWRDGGFHFWVLLFNPVDDAADQVDLAAEGFANHLKSCINQYTPFSASVALSDPFEDLSLLMVMRKQLQSLIRLRMVYGGNKVFSSRSTGSMVWKEEKPAFPEMKEMAGRAAGMLGQATDPDIEKQLHAFFSELSRLRSPDDIQFAIQYFVIQIYKECLERTESGLFLSDLDDLFELVKAESNLNRIKRVVKRHVMQVHHNMRSFQEAQVQDPVVKAKTWIKENLEQKISIKFISEHVYLNPTYFCEVFKKQTGQTVLDYITDVRLEKARELLMKSELKVGAISQMLGYQDTKYFSRLFKQKWGQLPSEYKKLPLL
jgi:two-component system response regulator YesN